MADLLLANNASALLAASITPTDTTIQVAPGFGALFPSPAGNQFFHMTLVDPNGDIEVVRVNSRTGDNMTVVRGQEGTTAQSWTLTTTRCELRLTAGQLNLFLQLSGGGMTGNIDMNANEIQDAVLTGALTSIQAGEVLTPIRGATGVIGNQIVVPANGIDNPTAGGVNLLKANDDIVALLDVAGVITFTSATIGVVVPGGAYLRVEGTSTAEFFQITHDDTDVNFVGGNVEELNNPIVLNQTAQVKLNDNLLTEAVFQDFSIGRQDVNADVVTDIDYTLGSYVNLTLDVNISTLTLSNPPPATRVGTLRIKIVHVGAGRTISWPASVRWPNNGTAPVLTGTDGAIDFVDLWTDDEGTTWYGAANTNWA